MNRTQSTAFCILLLIPLAGCPQQPDDGFEPNDTFGQATPLTLETTFKARAVQGNPDVLAVVLDERNGNKENQLEFDLATISGQTCPAFTVTAPDGSTLYQDTNRFCDREFTTPISVPGATLSEHGDSSFVLTVPALNAGTYFLTIEEKGQADNVIDYVWSYQVTAQTVE